MQPEASRDKVIQYWRAYYGEARDILDNVGWGAVEIPTHLRPQPRTIRVLQARDGFILNHFNRDSGTGWYEYFEIAPHMSRTMSEFTGDSFEYREGAPLFFSMADGRRLGHPQYDEALSPEFRQRYDIITNEHVPELGQDEARKNAREDLRLYLEIL